MFNKFVGASAVIGAAMVAAAPAQAAVFDFTTTSGTATSGTFGNNSGVLTSGNISVTVTAWSTSNNGTGDTPVAAYLGRYGGGFGVTNNGEGNGQTSNSHTIDNVVQYDFIRLEFSTAVSLSGLKRNGYDVGGPAPNPDTDAWVSYSTTGTDLFNAAGWGGTGGYLSRGTAVDSSATNWSSTNFAKVWIIGADRSGLNRNDGFKLGGVTALTPSVPEPATWGMMILGFGAIGGAMRRRKVATSVTYA